VPVLVLLLVFAGSGRLFAQQQKPKKGVDFFEMSLEELLDVEVVSSARRPQPLTRATSAIYVITAEDIRQAGVTSLTDLLRWVPGVQVAHTEGDGSFKLGIRGLARTECPQLQILLDGRPMYIPFKGGVKLAYHPIFLENIERIEVIRGSGGVVWGVNAMNGVINIITKKTADTQGGLGYGGFGNRALQDGFLRLGGTEGPLSWRGTVGAFHTNGFGTGGGDDRQRWMQSFQSTGRAELKLTDDTTLTFSGGHKHLTRMGTSDTEMKSMQYMNLAWQKTLENGGSFQVRWSEQYFDEDSSSKTKNVRTREDMLEIKHNFISGIHNIVWGADYTCDSFRSWKSTGSYTSPDSFTNDQASVFLEDEITLADNLWFTIGGREHYNELSHADWAGRGALVWEAAPKHFLRAAVSRSFRRPTFYEEFDVSRGNDDLDNETLMSYEIGYRGQLRKNLELNVEGFYNKHKDLIARTDKYYNVFDVATYGIETALSWKPYKWWLMRASHTYQHQSKESDINNSDGDGKIGVFTVPQHQLALLNRLYLDDSTTLNTQLFWSDTYFQDRFSSGAYTYRIDPYFRFDIRLARKIWNDTAEIAFGATNLTHHFHDEDGRGDRPVPRQIYFQFFYKF